MKTRISVSVLAGLVAAAMVTFICWMSGYDFTRGSKSDGGGFLWSSLTVLAFFTASFVVAIHPYWWEDHK